ncbi:FAD-binding oxidoreductase [Promicromonospora citrea]|uniref:6-hydroxy-D-nicotine oxidase n=1 Tax=Promicromonospora citrea TaxID=43677 RepID=A0A8H9GG60_9MICO|nr:FAD-binding oxidoreductase [Promicromonospora citrea]NNH51384.1 FAD-binding oxidoreductase [Promicromonospora citrea]GGM22902.1 6-hydroxy-D-nicotine oxidase [Promicromonospora citrea]
MSAPVEHPLDHLVDRLRSTLRSGTVVSTGPEYDAATHLWNGRVAARPGVVVRGAMPDDVGRAVVAAREAGVPVSVRGGGHDWAGRALRQGGLTVDLSTERNVTVYPAAQVAEVQAGATAADVAAAAAPYGLAPVTGTAGTVGLAGLTLGGGYGPLSGRFGLAADNLLSADVVLADGSVVTTDAEHEPDLFWALRGGGGNFGVVTSMRVRLRKVPTLLSGLVVFPWAQAGTVLTGLSELLAEQPDELTVQTGVVAGPDGGPVVFASPTWSGDDAGAGEHALARLGAVGTPLVSQVGPVTLPAMLAGIDAQFPAGRHVAIRTRTVPSLTTGVAEALAGAGDALTSPLSAVSLHSLHGAATRVPVTETAFGLRDPHLMVEIIATWEPGDALAAEHGAWADDVADALEPHALPGGYPNLLGPDALDQVAHAYGPHAARLLAVKERFDPDGVFRAIPLPDGAAAEARG